MAWEEVEAASLTEYPMTAPEPIKRARFQLVFRLKGGRRMAIEATLTRGMLDPDHPFVVWARAIERRF
jgi:hypothetical protein